MSALFDTSFTSFITTKLVKLAYVIAMLVAAFVALMVVVAGFSMGKLVGLIALVIGAPLVFLAYVIAARITLELLIVVFRMAEHTAEIARQGRGAHVG